MKKIYSFAFFTSLLLTATANAGYDSNRFQSEIMQGLDLISARTTVVEEVAPGELGREVYEIATAVDMPEIQMFIPTTMYVRMGGGLNLGFATTKAAYNGAEYESSGSYSTQIGLGWNLSSYVRTEIDFQASTFTFSDLTDMQATSKTIGGMLYFDFARRYVQTGDITRRRTFVPFMGLGAGVGVYEFEGAGGADGALIAAPRATLGFNVMFTDLIGIDIAYQYQMIIGNGFGWDTRAGGVDNISNLMATFRVNF